MLALNSVEAAQRRPQKDDTGEEDEDKSFLLCSGSIRQGPTFRFLARPRDELIVDVEMAGNVKLLISLRHPASLVVVLVVVSVADGLMLVLVFVTSLVVVEVAEGRRGPSEIISNIKLTTWSKIYQHLWFFAKHIYSCLVSTAMQK